jgi:hypothetical protein
MAYQANKPQATDALSQSQIDIQNNFGAIQTLVDVNHVDFASSDAGKHYKVTFTDQTGDVPAFLSGEIGVFNQLASPTSINDLWMVRGTAPAFPITGYVNNNVASTNGWTYIPSGLKIAWGIGVMNSPAVTATVIYGSALVNFPGFTTFWTAPQLTRLRSGPPPAENLVVVQSFSQTQFTAAATTTSNAGTIQFSWMIIGL